MAFPLVLGQGLNFSVYPNRQRLVGTQIGGPHPKVPDSVSLGWCLRISCISNKFRGDTDATDPGDALENQCSR